MIDLTTLPNINIDFTESLLNYNMPKRSIPLLKTKTIIIEDGGEGTGGRERERRGVEGMRRNLRRLSYKLGCSWVCVSFSSPIAQFNIHGRLRKSAIMAAVSMLSDIIFAYIDVMFVKEQLFTEFLEALQLLSFVPLGCNPYKAHA